MFVFPCDFVSYSLTEQRLPMYALAFRQPKFIDKVDNVHLLSTYSSAAFANTHVSGSCFYFYVVAVVTTSSTNCTCFHFSGSFVISEYDAFFCDQTAS